ncbi:MAG: hypothetical protein ACXWZ6_09890, partial [Solirubrobacterales bacterium]
LPPGGGRGPVARGPQVRRPVEPAALQPALHPDTGFYTGFTHGFLNPVFRGGNPRGTWRLVWWDTSSVTTHEIGTATLTVRTGKKFAKR